MRHGTLEFKEVLIYFQSQRMLTIRVDLPVFCYLFKVCESEFV